MPAIYAFLITAMGLGAGFFLSTIEQPRIYARFRNLDGLRGMAAVFVMIHNSALWYGYQTENKWYTSSPFYTHLGEGAVVIFFMLTGFLFWGKIRSSAHIDWQRLYHSRSRRIMPMYLFSIILLLAIALFSQYLTLIHHAGEIVGDFLLFRSSYLWRDYPDISLIDAGVTWTLAYEWFFYFSLPILAGFLYMTPANRRYWLFVYALLLILGFFRIWHLHAKFLMLFVYGAIAFELTRHPRITPLRQVMVSWKGTMLILLCSVIAIYHYENAYETGASFLYAVIFIVIAQGNSIFGLLESNATKILGDISYSTYLLHGIVLYCLFHVFHPATLSGHWLVAAGAVLCTILVSNITFLKIERVFMMNSTAAQQP